MLVDLSLVEVLGLHSMSQYRHDIDKPIQLGGGRLLYGLA
jgi:hypothetical protein